MLRGCLMHWEMCSSALGSPHWEPVAGDRQCTQNIQINKAIGEMKKCVLFYGKKN